MTKIDDRSLEQALLTISKDAMRGYLEVQRVGPCNMLDYRCVQAYADQEEEYALAALTGDEYMLIIRHYSALVKIYRLAGE